MTTLDAMEEKAFCFVHCIVLVTVRTNLAVHKPTIVANLGFSTTRTSSSTFCSSFKRLYLRFYPSVYCLLLNYYLCRYNWGHPIIQYSHKPQKVSFALDRYSVFSFGTPFWNVSRKVFGSLSIIGFT